MTRTKTKTTLQGLLQLCVVFFACCFFNASSHYRIDGLNQIPNSNNACKLQAQPPPPASEARTTNSTTMCGCWDSFWYKARDWLICLGAVLCVILLAGVVLVIVIFGGPLRHVKVSVEDASLTRFALVTAPTSTALAYNLTLALTVRNPNWAIRIKHDKPLEAAYKFDGQPFERVQLADKGAKLGTRKTVVYHLASGSEGRDVALGNAGEAEFRKENATGMFEVEVAVTGKFSYMLRKTKCKVEATCPLKLQLAAPGATSVVFQKVDCELAKSDDKYC